MAGQRIRACHVIRRFSPIIGGTELQLEQLMPHLADRGVEVTVLTRAHPGSPSRESLPGGTVIRVRGPAGQSVRASLAFAPAAQLHLLRRRNSFDVVHVHDAHSAGTVALGSRLIRLPTIVKITKTGPTGDWDRLHSEPWGRLRARGLVKRLRFVATSKEIHQELSSLGVEDRRIFRIPNGPDLNIFRPATSDEKAAARADLGLEERLYAAFVGRLVWQKHVDTLVRAVERLPQLTLIVVGDGPDREALEKLAADIGVAERVIFPGETRRVHMYLRAVDMFLFSTRAEGFPHSILEAMAAGLPIAAAPAAGIHQMLGDDERGLVINADDVDAWVAAARRFAEDRAFAAELGRRASEHIRQNWSLERTAEKIVAAYRKMLEEDGRR